MRLPVSSVHISVSIRDGDLIVNMIPEPSTGCQPKCEFVQVDEIPSECLSYIDQIERKLKEKQ